MNISDEAVEAAALSIHRAHPFQSLSICRAVARAALEAAAPHLRQAFYLEMNLRAVQDELRATPIYPLGKIEDKR